MSHAIPPKNAVWQWMIQPLRRYVDFSGRSGRREFWFYCLFLLLCYLAAIAIIVAVASAAEISNSGFNLGVGMTTLVLIGIIYVGNFVPGLALSARRLHDLGLSGWLLVAAALVIMFLNIFGWIGYMVVMALPPQKGTNAYGPPVYDEDMVADVFA